jgi:hypothetical protein
MAFDVQMVSFREFIRAVVRGAIDVRLSRALLREILESSRRAGVSRILVDTRGSDQRAIGRGDVLDLLAYMASLGFANAHRVAVVAEPGDGLEKAALAEESAYSQGLTIGAFSDFEAALAWLEGRSS